MSTLGDICKKLAGKINLHPIKEKKDSRMFVPLPKCKDLKHEAFDEAMTMLSRCKMEAGRTTGIEDIMKSISADKLAVEVKKEKANAFLEFYLSGKPLKEPVLDDFASEALIDAIINQNPIDIQYINAILLTDAKYEEVLKKDGGLLGIIPLERRTLLLCKVAVKEESYAERFVPVELKSLVNS